jgi:hypothetical protein
MGTLKYQTIIKSIGLKCGIYWYLEQHYFPLHFFRNLTRLLSLYGTPEKC